MKEFETYYQYLDETFEPNIFFIVAALLGLIIFCLSLSSLFDFMKVIKVQIRRRMLAISIFGLLLFGSVIAEYKVYRDAHKAFAGNASKFITETRSKKEIIKQALKH